MANKRPFVGENSTETTAVKIKRLDNAQQMEKDVSEGEDEDCKMLAAIFDCDVESEESYNDSEVDDESGDNCLSEEEGSESNDDTYMEDDSFIVSDTEEMDESCSDEHWKTSPRSRLDDDDDI